MGVQINFLSISAFFAALRPADSAFKTAEVNEPHFEPHSEPHIRTQGSVGTSRRTSTKTLVEDQDETPMEMVTWVAGVGDLCNGSSKTVLDLERPVRRILYSEMSTRPTCPLKDTNNKRSALQRHCEFWDTNGDGFIYPWDIFIGFRRLGFNLALCLWAAVTMALCSSYATQTSWLPHPMFAINLNNIHCSRHGSTTGAYDLDSELDTRRFEAIFDKYAAGKHYLTGQSLYEIWRGQCVANDWFGWFAGGLEWIAMYILLWPEDGKMYKDDVRGVYDGSIFWKIAEERAQKRK
ncbi:hypothetical protein ACN47E_009799 [Coniothyrium glycines]